MIWFSIELRDGVHDLVQHHLLLLLHFLLLAHHILLVFVLLLLELLVLGVGHGRGEQALVHLVLEVVGVFLELVAATVDFRLDAADLGLHDGAEVIRHVVALDDLVDIEEDDAAGGGGGVGLGGGSGNRGCVVAADGQQAGHEGGAEEGEDSFHVWYN